MSDSATASTTSASSTVPEKEKAPRRAPKKEKEEDKGKEEDKSRMTLKTPKGTTDYDPWQMAVRQRITTTITECFRRHGAVTIDTPVFELRDTLMGKYGEDSKLIYDLQDQGGEICSLRYDLTVPFARYMAMNHLKAMKRFHIAKVYRRDNPAMTKGRYREFYQCDFDIAGAYDLMVPDAECLATCKEALSQLNICDFVIKVNHRKILDGIFAIAGVPAEMFRTICSSVDKLDKAPWEEVEKEMLDKGLNLESAQKIKSFVTMNGMPLQVLGELRASGKCNGDKSAMQGLDEMEVLFKYCEAFGCIEKIRFDLSLARGLDYYTGLVFEAVFVGAQVGSVSGGGRYDNLVGIFGREQIPAVGFSLGLERIFALAEEIEKKKAHATRASQTEVYVAAQGGLLINRLELCKELWAAGLKAEFLYKGKCNMKQQLSRADELGCPMAVIIGESEIAEGVVQVKNLLKNIQVTIPRVNLVEALRCWLPVVQDETAPAFVLGIAIPKKAEEKKTEEKSE
eukprot:TRINITY_DN2480_c0_g1_i1.p1 TRINITY_DN2480_c0_g1~~TRINITY_DN2480_c0_g1_i1.p1  ORF type:complete len:512 (+),score=137.13 TRINITY_DN2480_c0_g1_i1:1446-2981(+)